MMAKLPTPLILGFLLWLPGILQVQAQQVTPTETAFQALRYWDDQVRSALAMGGPQTLDGIHVAAARESLTVARERFRALRGADGIDTAAARAMTAAWEGGLQGARVEAASEDTVTPNCDQHEGGGALRTMALSAAETFVYTCYGRAAGFIVVDADTLNRLAILGLLSRTPDRERRERLFRALEPTWRSVNGDNGPWSPYRALRHLRLVAWGDSGSPIADKGPAFGLREQDVEGWILAALERWRAGAGDSLVEPWDWYYRNGEASARLSPRLPAVEDLLRVNRAWYRVLGADPERLRVHYDLSPREGKDPVAFTDFAARNRWMDGQFVAGQPWVSASYLDGGFDNLAELLHETGHAIHIAGISARPAFLDWPDNDTFTEALADVPALELYEPAWQARFLGDSVPLVASLRAKYAGIMMDLAWALFEIRVHQDSLVDPNTVWTAITSEYLRIRPHPEWSWWAVRGQLIDAPGYLINYALGAFLTADIRARITALRGSLVVADTGTYTWLIERLYRFGGERPAREVLEAFLERPLRRDALLADLARMTP